TGVCAARAVSDFHVLSCRWPVIQADRPRHSHSCAFVGRVEKFDSLPEGRASVIVEVCESDFITVGCFVHLYWNMPPCHTILHPHRAVWSADCNIPPTPPHH